MCPPAEALHSPAQASRSDPSTAEPPDCIPEDPISLAAYTHAQKHLHPLILAHSVRVYLLAHHLATATNELSPWISPAKLPLLFTACILHDLGTSPTYNDVQRFEVGGADVAMSLLRHNGVSKDAAHEVWVAIALHTSPGIAEKISPFARLVRMAVLADFKRADALRSVSAEEVERVEDLFPRGEIEKVLGDVVVEQVLGLEGEYVRFADAKAPAASWPGILVKSARENPGWKGVNKAF